MFEKTCSIQRVIQGLTALVSGKGDFLNISGFALQHKEIAVIGRYTRRTGSS